jgi:MYXO-CTERM domain-containing protein
MDEFFRLSFTDSQSAAIGLVAAALVAWFVRRRIVRRRGNG